jgi:hypothetical protein
LAVAALIVVSVVIRIPTLDKPLLEVHGFRQTQTAYTALLFHEEGLSLLHPKLPVLGAPFEVPFEFPAFQALAGGVMWLGLPPDMSMRVTGLTCFLATALLLFGLVRRFGDLLAAFVSLAFFLFSPFDLLWGQASLMEFMATAAALGYLWAALECRERKGFGLAMIAVFAGSVACLVKITTALVYLPPIITYVATTDPQGFRGAVRARLTPTFGILLALPLAVGLLWTRHADMIKEGSELTRWLTSDALRAWNFGTWGQREESWRWVELARRFARDHLGIFLLPLFVAGLLQKRRRSLWLGMTGGAVAGVLVFFNLHVVHDYYQAALTPIVAAVAGVGASALFRLRRLAKYRRPAPVVVCIGLLMAVGVALDHFYWEQSWRGVPSNDVRLATARRIDAHSRPDERVAVLGFDWSPEVLYYARREGIAIPSNMVMATALAAIDGSYRVVALAPNADPVLRGELLDHFRSIRKVAPGIYRVRQPKP